MGKLALQTIWAAAALAAFVFEEGVALKNENGSQDGVLAPLPSIEELPQSSLETGTSTENSSCIAQGMTASFASERLFAVSPIDSVARCQLVCHEVEACLAAVFEPQSLTCYLLKVLRQVREDSSHHLVLPNCADSCYKKQRTFKGTGTKLGTAANAHFCQALCASTDDCGGFSYNKKTNECYSFGSHLPYKAHFRFISGDKHSCTVRSRQKHYAGTCARNNLASDTEENVKVGQNVGSFDECHELCLKTNECNWANYAKGEKRCYMKNSVGNLKQLNDVTTGPKFCDSSCFWKNIKVNNPDVGRLSNIADAHRCHYECTQNKRCKMWTHDETRKECLLSTNPQPMTSYESGYWAGIRDGCGKEEEYSARSVSCGLRKVKYNGRALETSTQDDAVECQEFCKDNDNCKAFAYNIRTRECLALPLTAASNREENADYISGPRVCDEPCFEEGVRRNGTVVGSIQKLWNADECKLRCQLSARCTHFSYAPATQDCSLYTSNGTVKLQGFISGPKSCNVHEKFPRVQGGCDIAGHEARKILWAHEINNKSLEECRNECSRNKNCTNFTYHKNNRKCMLGDHFALRAQRPNSNAVLGFKSCSDCFRRGVGYKPSSPEFLFGTVAQNAEECRVRCDLQELCYRFSFDNSRKSCLMFSGSPSHVERGAQLTSGPYRCPIERACLQYGKTIKSGTLVTSRNMSDEGQCQEWCGAYKDCQWFHFDMGNGFCKLYKSDIQLGDQRGNVVGTKKCMTDIADNALCEEHGFELEQKEAIREIKGIWTFPPCAAECRKDPRCRLWTLNVQFLYARCFLMTIKGFRHVGWHNHKQSGGRFGCPRCMRQGVAILGNIIKVVEARNERHCQFACEFEASCNNFTFAGNQCTLRSSYESSMTAGDNTFSGPKQC